MAATLSVYLDTSALNFLFADDAPEKKDITLDFFENFLKPGIYRPFISDFVLQEINQASSLEKRRALQDAVRDYFVELLVLDNIDEIQTLASNYLSEGVVPPNKILDALHIACAVDHEIDYLVSWNYKHLANVNREKKVLAVNVANNYLKFLIFELPFRTVEHSGLRDSLVAS